MCLDDGCDEMLCCLCAPLAALLCCKFCKDKRNRNNVHQAPPSPFHQQSSGHPIPVEDIYGPRSYHQPQFYPGGPQSQLYPGGLQPQFYPGGPQSQLYPGGPQPQFYPGGPEPYYAPQHHPIQENYFPPHQGYTPNDLPSVYVKQQPRPYK